MLPEAEIQKYGGKAAILNHMRERLPDLPIPRYVVHEAGQDFESALRAFRSLAQPVIVRSSSPYEYAGFEGIFDSVPDVHNEQQLERAIQQVEASAQSERARKYADTHGLTLDGRMHIIIQEQSPSQYQGAMMRHPNNPEQVFILLYQKSFSKAYEGGVYNEIKGKLEEFHLCEEGHFGDTGETLVKLFVDVLHQLEDGTSISDNEVLYVEFGHEPFAVYQARPFRKKETASFDLPDLPEIANVSFQLTNVTFGITPPEGISLPVLRSFGYPFLDVAAESAFAQLYGSGGAVVFGDYEIELAQTLANFNQRKHSFDHRYFRRNFAQLMETHHEDMGARIEGAYCFLTNSAKREDYDVDLTIPKMKSLVLGHGERFLTHGLMRLLKQAEVSAVFNQTLYATDLYQKTRGRTDRIRLISNGREAVAFRE